MQVKVCGKCGMVSDANEPCGVCALRSALARAEAVCEAAMEHRHYLECGCRLCTALRAWRAGKEGSGR